MKSVDALRARVEELEAEIGDLEDALRRPPDKAQVRRIEAHRDVDGTVEEEVFEEIVSRLRRTFSSLGDVELIGRTMTWTLKPNAQAGVTRMLQVSISPRGNGTRIRVVDDLQLAFNNRVAGYTVGLGFVGFGALAALGAAIAGPALVPLGLAAPFITHQLGKRSFRQLETKRREELDALLTELSSVVVELASGEQEEEQ